MTMEEIIVYIILGFSGTAVTICGYKVIRKVLLMIKQTARGDVILLGSIGTFLVILYFLLEHEIIGLIFSKITGF